MTRRPLSILIALFVVACQPAASASPSVSVAPSATAETSPSESPSASVGPLGTVRLALDWTPNTNHTGFFVAAANGWYEHAGVDLQILPYASTTPEALIAHALKVARQ